jgi:hypothetical protein
MCGANNVPILECEQRHIREGSTLDLTLGADTGTATLAWLVSALEQARREGQCKAVDYLEAVLDDAVFEMEIAARRSRDM